MFGEDRNMNPNNLFMTLVSILIAVLLMLIAPPGGGEDQDNDDESTFECTVIFELNNGVDDNVSITVTKGETISDPPTPARYGYEFAYWSCADEFFDINNDITSDLTLVAQWGSAGLEYSVDGIVSRGTFYSTHLLIPEYFNGIRIVGMNDNAFRNCDFIETVVIGNGIETIVDYAFYGCSFLTVTIGNSVKVIGNDAFSGCPIFTVTIPDSVKVIGIDAFWGCPLRTIVIGNGVETIGSSAFAGCQLKTVTIPDSVVSIGNTSFSQCSLLETITIGSGVKTIGDYAFWGCEKFHDLYLPESASGEIVTLGDGVFFDTPMFTIHAPSDLLDLYKNDSKWGSVNATWVILP